MKQNSIHRHGDVVHSVLDALTDMVKHSRRVDILRSGYYPQDIDAFVSAIVLGCQTSESTKHIRVIIPSLRSVDSQQRKLDLANQQDALHQRDQIKLWRTRICELKDAVGQHIIELRETTNPHLYHLFLGDKYALFGQAWHFTPSMKRSTYISQGTEEFNLAQEDFEKLWSRAKESEGEPMELLHSILFSDIEGFTNRSQSMSPKSIQEMILSHRDIIEDATRLFGGQVVNRIGDAMVVAFQGVGAAVKAALQAQVLVAQRNADNSIVKSKHYQLRIGISTGSVLIISEEGTLMTFDVFGHPVNLASRIQHIAQAGEVIVCGQTQINFKEEGIILEERPEVKVSGVDQMIKIYRAVTKD